jgi:hypothetical protein
MARTKKISLDVKEVTPLQPQGKFMLVWHDKPGTFIVGSPNAAELPDLVIPPGQKVVADEAFMNVPHFVRDMDDGILHVERSNRVPKVVPFTVSAKWDSVLDNNQKQLARFICETEPLTEQIMGNINLHKLLGPGGVSKQGTKVTKRYLTEKHRVFLMATAELEATRKNREYVIKTLNDAVQAIDSL